MKQRLLFIAFYLLIAFSEGEAQSNAIDIKLPQLLPPSPEVAGFVKAGYGSANMSNGAVSASIPVYTIKVKDLSWPVSLSYSSQGVKTDEYTSRVGYGWNLNAGGVITRTVMGKPDEISQTQPLPFNIHIADSSTYRYVSNATDINLSFDSEPDVYHFNFGGVSGKFVFDEAGNPVVTSHSNLKIQVTSSSRENFIITTTDGVKYFFGGSEYEYVRSNNFNALQNYMNTLRTSFFLYKIEIPGGEKIDFSYSSIQTNVVTGIEQSMSKNYSSMDDNCLTCPINSGGNIVSTHESVNKVQYTTRYLTNVTSSNGQLVHFSYGARPDLSGDNRVTSIDVSGNQRTLRHLKLSYYDPPGFDGSAYALGVNNAVIGRFFLTELKEKSAPALDHPETADSQVYKLEYVDLENTPMPVSTKQDYWGFANNNPGTLLPYQPEFSLIGPNPMLTGNRNPSPEVAQKGILRSITYPTGGKEEFFYEGNTIFNYVTNPLLPKTEYVEGSYAGSDTYFDRYSSYFSIPFDQTVDIAMACNYSGSGTAPVGRIVTFNLLRGSEIVYTNWLQGNESLNSIHGLVAGTYRLQIRIRNDAYNSGYFGLTYDTAQTATTYPTNTVVGGVRLRKIKYSTPESQSGYSKFFTYRSLEGTFSSGVGQTSVPFYSLTKEGRNCSGLWGVTSVCQYATINSNTSYPLNTMNNNHIFYSSVIESDDSLFSHGGTEYSFVTPDPASTAETIWGEGVPNMPLDNYGTLNGELWRTRVFDNNKTIKRDDYFRWDSIQPPNKTVKAVFVKKNYDYLAVPPYDDEMLAFDVVTYYYQDVWYRKQSAISKRYELADMAFDSTVFNYGSPDNILPAETITTDSRGDIIKSAVKYPTDYSTNTVLSQMVGKNMIAMPVEESSYYNNVLQQQKVTGYKNWLSLNDVIKPDTVKVKASQADVLHDALYYEYYDSSGNILQARKPFSNPVSFIWDHHKTFPVAEVSNAGFNQVAYTGFEGDGWGNWSVSSGNTVQGSAFAGFNSFAGTLMRTSLPSATYTVSAWAKGGISVNSQNGTLVRTVRGWSLYKWTLTNPGTVTVVADLVDELRLLPVSAMMSTTSYIPFVGSSAKADANSIPAYYEYDYFNRLVRIRDVDSNIVKQYQYKLLQPIGSCTDTMPEWTATGVLTCIKTENNNNTGYAKQEERDLNPCSSSYLRYRASTVVLSSTCPVVADCSGPNKRVINGACETGVKIYTESRQNGTTWTCDYHYEFSDGYWSGTFSESSPQRCASELVF